MKISVIIPAYNAEKHVARAIESVLAQTRPADEIIVIDDGSTDGTADVIRSFGDRVILIQQPNAGVSVARNTGINAATGDWIAFLDADDEWRPEKLKLQTDHLARNPDLKWTYSNFYRKEPNLKDLKLAHSSLQLKGLLSKESFSDYLCAYIHSAYAWTSVLVIHRQVFDAVGLFEPGMKRAQDNDLWFRIAYQYPQVGYVPEPLAIYHLDTPASSTKINDSVDFMIDLVRRHEKLSKQYGRDGAFRLCITQMVQNWIRQLEKQGRCKDADLILEQFKAYVSKRFRREMRFRLCCPPITSRLADLAMRFKRNAKQDTRCR